MKIFIIFLFWTCSSQHLADRESSNEFLSRERRANGGFLEEMQAANFERECIEETCNNEELRETMPKHSPYQDINRRRETYAKCKGLVDDDASFRTLSSQAKNRKLTECMEDPDQCEVNPCSENADSSRYSNGCKDLINDYECICNKGWGGKHCEILLDHCILEPCGEHGRCITGYQSYTCECYQNWEGINCDEEILDCRRKSGNQNDEEYDCVHGTCVEMNSTWECDCSAGWQSEGPVAKCDQDEDECETGSEQCDQECINTIGSYRCNCKMGFILNALDSHSCDDINECDSHNAGGCDQVKGGCKNSIGSFACFCNDGYALDFLHQKYCNDVNECKKDNGGCTQECVNIDGSYECRCHSGYYMEGDDKTCVDLDECDCQNLSDEIMDTVYDFKCLENGGCEQVCNNSNGSFACDCNPGYELTNNDLNCRNVNECLTGGHECHHICVDNIGSYECVCENGYKLAIDGRQCEDIDECEIGTHRCRSPAKCVNTVGEYECECDPGYNKVGRNCYDINECNFDDPICMHDASCFNTVGNFTCDCMDTGYTSHTCNNDVDECRCMDPQDQTYRKFTGECRAVKQTCAHMSECTNEEGSYTCGCRKGWTLMDDDHSCEDIDECKCSRDPAYAKGLNGACNDLQECDHTCANMPGGYQCRCHDGHWLQEDKHTCSDVDECRCMTDAGYYNKVTKVSAVCATAARSPCEHKLCANLKGGYQCQCKDGFNLDQNGYSCNDIDECELGANNCQHKCVNNDGSFSCACNDGFILDTDNKSCIDRDECENSKCDLMRGTCIDKKGTYECKCRDGYKLGNDGYSCDDVDECSESTCPCDYNQSCVNELGDFMCKSEDVQKSCHSDAQTILNAIHTGRDTDTGYYAIEGKLEDSDFNLEFKFRTLDDSGVIMQWSSKKSTRKNRKSKQKARSQRLLIELQKEVFVIQLLEYHNGKFNGNHEVISESRNNTETTNGLWHELYISRNSTLLIIKLNNIALFKYPIQESASFSTNLRTMYLGGVPTSKEPTRSPKDLSLDACFELDGKFFDTYPKDQLPEQCSDCCHNAIQKGIYSDGSGFAELDITKFVNDKRASLFQMITFRFSFLMESPQGTIFSVGPIRLYAQGGRLHISFNNREKFEIKQSSNCTGFPAKVCDGEAHQIEVRMCFSPSCATASGRSRSHFAGIMIDRKMYMFDDFLKDAHKPTSKLTKMFIGGLPDEHNESFKGSFLSYESSNAGVIEFKTLRGWNNANEFKRYKGIRTHSAPKYNGNSLKPF